MKAVDPSPAALRRAPFKEAFVSLAPFSLICVYAANKKTQDSFMDVLVRLFKGNVEIEFRSLGVAIDPMVDVEECKKWSNVQFQDSLMRFIQLVKSLYGKAPMIYSVNTFYNKFCAPKFNNYHLMIGRYGKNEPIIKGKGTYTIWQQSQKGKISGISKNVDIDVFHRQVSVTDIILVKNEE